VVWRRRTELPCIREQGWAAKASPPASMRQGQLVVVLRRHHRGDLLPPRGLREPKHPPASAATDLVAGGERRAGGGAKAGNGGTALVTTTCSRDFTPPSLSSNRAGVTAAGGPPRRRRRSEQGQGSALESASSRWTSRHDSELEVDLAALWETASSRWTTQLSGRRRARGGPRGASGPRGSSHGRRPSRLHFSSAAPVSPPGSGLQLPLLSPPRSAAAADISSSLHPLPAAGAEQQRPPVGPANRPSRVSPSPGDMKEDGGRRDFPVSLQETAAG
jgi:hypothetical protein